MSNTINATVAAKKNFVVKQHQTFKMLLTFTDADTGDPIDFTGATVSMWIRKGSAACFPGCNEQATNLVFKQDITPTIAGNQLQIDDVINLATGNYKYDILVIFPDGTQTYYLRGDFTVEKSITNVD